MGRRIVCLFLVQAFISQIPSSQAQRSISQYLHLTGLPYTAQAPTTAVVTNKVNPRTQVSIPRPTTGITSLAGLSLPSLISALAQAKPKLPEIETPKPTSNIDARLLNNLAIALQLLVLSNILNQPKESVAEKANEIIPEQPLSIFPTQNYVPTQNGCVTTQNSCATPQNYIVATQMSNIQPLTPCSTQNQFLSSQPEPVMPNANFVGGSGFEGPKMTPILNPVRSTMTLMSPYEALGTLTSDSMPKFMSSNPRKDFQSPYAMIDKDYFPSPNDLF